MDIEFAEQYGETLLDYAFDMLWQRETCGVNHAEFIFVRLSEHLKEYPELKHWFLAGVEKNLSETWRNLAIAPKRPIGFIPSELIEYIANVTKWAELEKLSLLELEKHKGDDIYLSGRNLPSSILEALKSDWEDIDMYPSLNNEHAASNK